MPKSTFQILHQVSPTTSRPWRLIEVYDSADGLRTRVCSGAWRELEEVQARLAEISKERLAAELTKLAKAGAPQ